MADANDVTDDEVTSCETFAKNKRETVRCYFSKYKGKKQFSIRVYAPNKEGVEVPTPKGITIDAALVDTLLEAINASADAEIKLIQSKKAKP